MPASTQPAAKRKKKAADIETKSPAEFFAEHHTIAGFGTPGKSLYTTLRELVENSLDACEEIRVLPEIEITVEELTTAAFQQKLRSAHGSSTRKDESLFKEGGGARAASESKGNGAKKAAKEGFFRVRCKDNGCGVQYSRIPGLFGKVLAGSKYSVKQARGKFGLGAKMALIWSKKSTGLPIEITSAHTRTAGKAPKERSFCRLDIDIHRNEPNVKKHEKLPQPEGETDWHGTIVELFIGGNWSTYKARITNYLQQLAVITPYAELVFRYVCGSNESRSFTLRYKRRSEQICKSALEVKHHPSSVDQLLISQLLAKTKAKNLQSFLRRELTSIDAPLATRLVVELEKSAKDKSFDPEVTTCEELAQNQAVVHHLTRLLKETTVFPPPDGGCLSPAGEYNLRLGILKEFEPHMVATASSKCSAHGGHPFIVEAAVAVGGSGEKLRPGVTVYRFANRIPLLFEGGSDVSTITANQRVKWGYYGINHKVEKVGVFVSIVSTKIPFKGTGKEYIGDDSREIRESVKSALTKCCGQLKKQLAKRQAQKDQKKRKGELTRYIPDVTRAIFGVLDAVCRGEAERRKRQREAVGSAADEGAASSSAADSKRARTRADIEKFCSERSLTEDVLAAKLSDAIAKADASGGLDLVANLGRQFDERKSVHLVPATPVADDEDEAEAEGEVHEALYHPALALRLWRACERSELLSAAPG